ncbi:methyltransferase domain-containing protein [Aspergillus caelatus]|uniref:Methyltransferase domain-containing protein n=1 Tax=Aspergillus caelatus TaxID=61420 RepID=A0A5N7ACM2_9EURO|nr:methyltransferase domain-containing protein [Aspergillus caelatus]KAE8367627.1 methyltransferase domain-containing protein [Aspergillus caelatus]
MPRPKTLPLTEEWTDPDAYVDALLSFATSSDIFRHLCGGVHILDFLTREPDLYTSLLPEHWRAFFEHHDIQDLLDLFLREDLQPLLDQSKDLATDGGNPKPRQEWGGAPLPPTDLLEYLQQIRRLSLGREFRPPQPGKPTIPRHIAVGMNVKKYHEVAHFSRYVDSLCATADEQRGENITHVVDFGSGQSYLGRTLASPPYNQHIIAIERKHQFINGAMGFDIFAKLKEKKMIRLYNKKAACKDCEEAEGPVTVDQNAFPRESEGAENVTPDDSANRDVDEEDVAMINVFRDISIAPDEIGSAPHKNDPNKKAMALAAKKQESNQPRGTMDYIEHDIKNGYLEPIIKDVIEPPSVAPAENSTSAEQESNVKPNDARVMVVSLHSCGNLLHHGVQSLVLNPSVKAIAMIGCCYNLMTERLGPATYKLPILRTMHPRLTKDAVAYDPHGFPMSKRLEDYEHDSGRGVKLNITARSMAVQAPYNWGREDSENFFTRHFYRSLLQKVLVDRGVVAKPSIPKELYGAESLDSGEAGNPLIVGSLRKSAFASFPAYARAAVVKLSRDPHNGEKVKAGMADITEEELNDYVEKYWHMRKYLGIVWSLMAYSSSLVEAIIVVDRWQFLREHDGVKDCWVEPVFDYSVSPRNLAVIGIKK